MMEVNYLPKINDGEAVSNAIIQSLGVRQGGCLLRFSSFML
jgi:hypothetical protein